MAGLVSTGAKRFSASEKISLMDAITGNLVRRELNVIGVYNVFSRNSYANIVSLVIGMSFPFYGIPITECFIDGYHQIVGVVVDEESKVISNQSPSVGEKLITLPENTSVRLAMGSQSDAEAKDGARHVPCR